MSKSGNTTVISVGYADPNQATSTQVGAGVYSLNKRSNVPFVQFIGSAGYRKTISWGEICEVPAKEVVTVWNASYHGGDIFINKGPDMCNRPSRISVPVPYQTARYLDPDGIASYINVWRPIFPCDTRAAKRAYLNIDAYVTPVPPSDFIAFVRGRRLNGSMQCANSLSQFAPPYGPGVGFLNALVYPALQTLSYIPLGQGASPGDDTRPHNLLDAGDVFFDLDENGVIADWFSWPADSALSGFPSGAASAPGTWYVIEYD